MRLQALIQLCPRSEYAVAESLIGPHALHPEWDHFTPVIKVKGKDHAHREEVHGQRESHTTTVINRLLPIRSAG